MPDSVNINPDGLTLAILSALEYYTASRGITSEGVDRFRRHLCHALNLPLPHTSLTAEDVHRVAVLENLAVLPIYECARISLSTEADAYNTASNGVEYWPVPHGAMVTILFRGDAVPEEVPMLLRAAADALEEARMDMLGLPLMEFTDPADQALDQDQTTE